MCLSVVSADILYMYMCCRVLADYSADGTHFDLPSRSLALQHGDVLQVTGVCDNDWWLARRVFPLTDTDCVGVIPSKTRSAESFTYTLF